MNCKVGHAVPPKTSHASSYTKHMHSTHVYMCVCVKQTLQYAIKLRINCILSIQPVNGQGECRSTIYVLLSLSIWSHARPLIISTCDIIPDRPPVTTHAPGVQPSCKQASAPIEGGNSNQLDIWTGKTTRASTQGGKRSFPHKPRVNVQRRTQRALWMTLWMLPLKSLHLLS